MEFYINDLFAKGITYIAPFKDEAEPVEACQQELNDNVESEPPTPVTIIKEKSPGCLSGIGERIDSDYIARFLGDLDPFQESDLIKVCHDDQACSNY